MTVVADVNFAPEFQPPSSKVIKLSENVDVATVQVMISLLLTVSLLMNVTASFVPLGGGFTVYTTRTTPLH
jgi:hypothetical protein